MLYQNIQKLYECPPFCNFFYQDAGFMSSSPAPSGLTKYKDILFEIKTQKGTSIIDLNAINPVEREVLFLPGQLFHIDGVEIRDDYYKKGQVVIKMTSIPSVNTSSENLFNVFNQKNNEIQDYQKNNDTEDENDDWNDLPLGNEVVIGPPIILMPDEDGPHLFNEWNEFFYEYLNNSFSKIKINGKESSIYANVPSFNT